MKIGLYGGMANSMYRFAKGLQSKGVNVVLFEDLYDRYPISQPFWDDLEMAYDYDQLGTHCFSFDEEYVPKVPFVTEKDINDKNTPPHMLFTPKERVLMEVMKTCDVILATGIKGPLYALKTGKPYLIWPHGGDLRQALGMIPRPKVSGLKNNVLSFLHYSLLKKSYKKSKTIVTHDPHGGIGGYQSIFVHKPFGKTVMFLPIPIPLISSNKKESLEKIAPYVDTTCVKNKKIVFIPSRIDFFWKKQDILLDAMRHMSGFHLIFTGWGNDYEKAKILVRDYGLENKVTFLNKIFSRSILNDFFKAADLVIDQFTIGTYGTAAIEAMACGAPVMMYINNEVFEKRGWEPPPVINVKSADDIRASLLGIEKGTIDLQKKGEECLEWVKRVHSPENAYDCLMKCVNW